MSEASSLGHLKNRTASPSFRTMQTSHTVRLPARLHTLATMAALLQRLEGQRTSASADQYRRVAQQVSTLLAAADPGDDLDKLLAIAPVTAELLGFGAGCVGRVVAGGGPG